MLALVWTITVWSDLQARAFGDPDDAARLVQVRELSSGQSWWDLTLDRIGLAGAEMHWSRHMDGLLAGTMAVLRPVLGSDAAEIAAMIVVPLGLLLVALWLISSLARILWPGQDVGLYAMVVFGFGAGSFDRFSPGALDHHGLQSVLVLLMVRMVLVAPSWGARLVAGVAGGVSLTIGLETLPVLAAVLAGVGIGWAVGVTRPRAMYRWLGLGLVGAATVSSLLSGPPGRLFSRDCDVLSLGFFGLMAVPAVGLAVVGGSDWPPRLRWAALGAMGAAGLSWFALVSPTCSAGPYGSIPALGHRIWIDMIAEARGLTDIATAHPLEGVALALGPVVGLLTLAWIMRSSRTLEWMPLLVALGMTMVFGMWQVRMVPVAVALSAPVLGGLVVRIRNRVSWVPGRTVAALAAALVLSGFLFGLIGRQGSSTRDATALEPCVTEDLLDGLGELEAGSIAVEMNFGPAILVHTDHRILASPYHRAYEGVLTVYGLFVADPGEAESQARSVGVTYVMVCDGTAVSEAWSADNDEGLLAALLDDDPPQWLEKVIDTGRSRVYAVR